MKQRTFTHYRSDYEAWKSLDLVLIFTYEIVTDIDGNTSPGQVGVDEDRVRQGEAVLGHSERTTELVQQCQAISR